MSMQMKQAPPGPPDEAPPGSPARGPRWPAWYAPAAFVVALVAVAIVVAIAQAIVTSSGHHITTSGPAFEVGGTLLQDVLLVAVAVAFAARVARPRPWQFGLRGVNLWYALRAAFVSYAAFWVLSAIYQAAFHPHGRQTVAKDLGANNGGALLVLAAILVIVVAPAAEEFFFRGFFYRALRSRFPVLIAALIDGAVFGGIHYTGAQTAAVLPVLAALGFIFCLLFEATGSILPGIALHAINNSISYAVTVHSSSGVAVALGAAMVAACIAAPRWLPALRAAPR